MRRWSACLALALLLVAAGCDDPLSFPLHSTEPPPGSLGRRFDAAAAGTITGQVTWAGPVPRVPDFRAPLSTVTEGRNRALHSWTNPHAPRIDPAGRGLAGAVIFLEGIDPEQGRPWDLPPVRVAIKDGQFHIDQDGARRAGFLRPGDAVSLVCRDVWFEILQGRDAAFFSIALPEPDKVRSRRLTEPGHVELISGAGHYWMRGHLFVVGHPYYTTTDAAGRFVLPRVPPGEYRLVCWHPNWHPAAYERDIGTLLYTHLRYGPPFESAQPVRVERGRTAEATFTIRASDFTR